jgi:hypothetical protein
MEQINRNSIATKSNRPIQAAITLVGPGTIPISPTQMNHSSNLLAESAFVRTALIERKNDMSHLGTLELSCESSVARWDRPSSSKKIEFIGRFRSPPLLGGNSETF